MNFELSEEQVAVRDLAAQVFTGSVSVERVKEIEASEERFDRALWQQLADAGSARHLAARGARWQRARDRGDVPRAHAAGPCGGAGAAVGDSRVRGVDHRGRGHGGAAGGVAAGRGVW